MSLISRLLAPAALSLILASGAAMAADHSAHMAVPGNPDRMQSMCGDMDAKMAGKIAYAEVKLNLTAAQKAEFKTLTETMKTAHEPMKKVCADMVAQPPATTLPGHMERMQKMMEIRGQAMKAVIPAINRFYGTLTPDQQKTADGMMMSHHGMGH
ncbi:conserved exported hypothetical protein [Candidatus Terasakiella magnetica]|nr:conserved exported hypothetical protein [Candidatus Terasakiella magnetica]